MKQGSGTFPLMLLLLALGAQTLIVELTIPRMIAPVFGNTLFSWTAIIAVVLISLTAGYRLGGYLASSNKNIIKMISLISVCAAVWVLLLALTGDVVVKKLSFLNMMFGPLVAATILAAVPAFLDAVVVPMAIQLRPEDPGESSGICFAWSTVGSIFGVLLTGYVLLPQLGISGALITGVVMVSAALLLLGKRGLFAMTVIAIVTTIVISNLQASQYLFDKSNGYHRIRVTQAGTDIRSLYLDNTLESQIRLGTDIPVSGYYLSAKQVFDLMTEFDRAFFIGGGAFSIPRYLKSLHPETEVVAAEIDRDVVQVSRDLMELPETIKVQIGDGRKVLEEETGRFDLIVNDAFHGIRNMPFHLTTHEFNEIVAGKLAKTGIYAM
ncbi:MAG: fused MFS/spermidine synthase, partial [Arenicellales bacterium]